MHMCMHVLVCVYVEACIYVPVHECISVFLCPYMHISLSHNEKEPGCKPSPERSQKC